MNGQLTKDTFRLLFHTLAEKSQFMSFSYLWQRLPEYPVLKRWAREHKALSLLVLFEELETHPWIALDLIHATARKDLLSIGRRHRGRMDHVLSYLLRWAIGHGYNSQKIHDAYKRICDQIKMERDIQQVIRRLNRCRTQKRDVTRMFALANVTMVGIAHRNHELFYDIVVEKHLLWMGLQGKPDDPRLARLFSDILCLVAPPPIGISEARTCKEIYEAWFQFGKPTFFKDRIKNLDD